MCFIAPAMCSGASTEINSNDNVNVSSIYSIFICIISPCFWWHRRCEICWATNEHFMMMSGKVSKNPTWRENDRRYSSACPPQVRKHRVCGVFIADSAFATVISTTSLTDNRLGGCLVTSDLICTHKQTTIKCSNQSEGYWWEWWIVTSPLPINYL